MTATTLRALLESLYRGDAMPILSFSVSLALVMALQDEPAIEGSLDETSASPAASEASEPLEVVGDDENFTDGMAYYNKLEFEKASFRFRAATRATNRRSEELARAHLWLGLSLAQGGDEIGAKEEFSKAVGLDASIGLPPDMPPTIRPLFDEARTSPAVTLVAGDTTKPADEAQPAGEPHLTLPAMIGAGVTGAGVLAFAGGAAFGVIALGQADAANKERFQDDAFAAYDAASTSALAANILIVGGAAACVAGASLVVVSALIE